MDASEPSLAIRTPIGHRDGSVARHRLWARVVGAGDAIVDVAVIAIPGLLAELHHGVDVAVVGGSAAIPFADGP